MKRDGVVLSLSSVFRAKENYNSLGVFIAFLFPLFVTETTKENILFKRRKCVIQK